MSLSKITLIKAKIPKLDTINKKILFIGGSLGLFNPRDKNKSCFRIFVKLLSSKELSSNEIAADLRLSRGTVVFHLHKLADAGIVVRKYGKYMISFNNLETLLDSLEKDIDDSFSFLKKIAKDVDREIKKL